MSLNPIQSDIILKAERLIKQGATYKQIKEICHISDGTIAKIKQGKITSDRVIEPICNSRTEELSFLYNSIKERYSKSLLELQEQEKIIENLKERNSILTERNEKLELEQEELLLRNKELREIIVKLQKALKGSQDNFIDIQRNISPVNPSNAFKTPPRASKSDEMDLFGSSEIDKEQPKEKSTVDLFRSSAF